MSNYSIRTAVIGYGGAYNMGKLHAQQMLAAGMSFVAACDLDPARMQQAQEDFPDIRTYTSVEELLAQPDIDLVTVITPHHTHADLASLVLASGKNCILEKPMCIRAEDAYALTEQAKQAGRMLSVFHNRRWDGWYLTLQDVIERGLLGDIFHVEMFMGGHRHPGYWWRSDKLVSGGAFYDWGAHYLDWLLGFVPGSVTSVRGHVHNRVWHDVTNEDQVDSTILFASGAVAHVQISAIARAGKPKVRILGTKGAVVDAELFDGHFILHTEAGGLPVETKLTTAKENHAAYYRNIFEHLTNGAELIVKPEQAARTIAIIEATERSAEEGRELFVSI
ncbi:Gfo/Idh/MocA family protein [Paenibacillus koleovorans]|uniref:Gfo/Idh/MocA family protein n=1 Tax=Paenibacillus koleovorans TaxID=121608 RepID=UPI000FD8427D|nr:Gfo/Idh/MocA family oxidoreductase [Paenibacillus koleovorans]